MLCTYYEYTYCKGVTNIMVQICPKKKKLLIMSKDVVAKRSNKGGCFAFFSCCKSNKDIPDMPINTSVKLNNKSKLKGVFGIQKSINLSIDLKKLTGFIIGANS